MKKKSAMEDESEADPARNDLMKKAVAAFQAARNKVEMGLVQLLKTEGRAGNIKIDTMEAAYNLYVSAKSDKLFEGLYEAECREAGLKKPPEHSIQFTRPLRAVAIRSPKVQKELRDKEAQKRFKGTLNNMSNALIAADSRIREEHGGKLPPEVPAGTVAAKIKAIGSLTEAYKLGREIGQAGASKPNCPF